MNEPVQRDQAQSQPAPSKPVHPVDEILPLPKLFALGLQHVLVMYANAVAVPLIIGGALHLPKDQMAMLINADLFACGIATLIQTVGFGPFGIRLPIIMGVTAVSISPMLAMAAMPGVGLTGNLRRRPGRRHFRPLRRAVRQIRAAVFPRGRHRHHHHHDRRRADARRRELGGRRRGQGGFRRGRLSDGRRPGALLILLVIKFTRGFRAERGRADRHHRRLSRHHRARLDRFLRNPRGADRARRHAAAVRRAAILSDPVPDHVPRGDDRLHRGDRHVSGARRHDRPQGRAPKTSNAGCARIRSAPSSARSSTRSPTSRIRRISAWSASPASTAAGSASPAASSCWCSA